MTEQAGDDAPAGRGVLMLWLDASGKVLRTNRTFELVTAGEAPRVALGQAAYDRLLVMCRDVAAGRRAHAMTAELNCAGAPHVIEWYGEQVVGATSPEVLLVGVDVTAREQAGRRVEHLEAELERVREDLRTTQRIAGVGSCDVDARTREATWSEETYRILEINPANKTGLYELFVSRVHPDDFKEGLGRYERAVAGATALDQELRFVMEDGRIKYVRLRADALSMEVDERGRAVRMRGTVEDVTERRLAEQALRESELRYEGERELLRSIIDAFPGYVGLYDTELTAIDANAVGKAYRKQHGGDRPGTKLLDMPHWSGSAELREQARLAAARAIAGERVRFDAQVEVGPRTAANVDVTFSPIFDSTGKITYLATFGVDVTARQTALKRLHEGEAMLDEVQRIAKLGGWEHDVRTGQVQWAREMFRILELDPETTVPCFDSMIARVHPDDVATVRGEAQRAVATKGSFDNTCRLVMTNGRIKWVHRRCEVICDDSGEISRLVGTMQDITERVEAQQALTASDQRFRQVVEHARDAIFQADPATGLFLDANPCGVEMLGYTLDELRRLRLSDLCHPDDPPGRYGEMAEGRTLYARRRLRRKDGTWIFLEFRAGLLSDGTSLAIVRDVTARALAEEEERRARELLRAVIDSSPDWITVKDMQRRYLLVNESFARAHGRHSAALVGVPDTEIEHTVPESQVPSDGACRDAAMRGLVRTPRVIAKTVSGEERVFDVHRGPLLDDAGNSYAMLTYAHDVTDEELAQKALRDREMRLAVVFDTASEAMALFAATGSFPCLAANRTFLRRLVPFVEISEAELTTLNLSSLFTKAGAAPGRFEWYESFFRQCIETRAAVTFEHEILAPPSTLAAEVTLAPVVEGGACKYVLWSSRDVTVHKRAAESLRSSLAEKDNLLREVHHRVKNNLQVISSLLALQAGRVTHPGAREALEESERRVRSMAAVHERLYRSKNFAEVDLGEHLASLSAAIAESYASRSKVTIVFEMGHVTVPLETAVPLGLILNELLANAYKHAFPDGRTGSIEVGCGREGNAVVLRVADDGIGAKGLAPDSTSTLGVSLVKTLVRQLRGQLEFRTSSGTLATVTVPLSRETAGMS